MPAIPSHLLAVVLQLAWVAPEWREITFGDIPANRAVFAADSLRIEVRGSTSALVKQLPENFVAGGVVVSGRIDGELAIPESELWADEYDDAYLRIGLIEAGGKRLTPLQRIAAPRWIRDLEELFGRDGGGIGKIRCALLAPHSSWVGETRTNPKAALFEEFVAGAPGADGAFRIEWRWNEPAEIVGLWLQADGDDTGSDFNLTIESVTILPPAN